MKHLILPAIFIFTFLSGIMAQNLKPAGIFTDNMVLQQQSKVAIWGWSKANANVKVTCSWNKKSYSTKSNGEGYWKLTVQTSDASYTSYNLTISGNGASITLKNILIGEVWICSGQSNMEMPMKGNPGSPVAGGNEAIILSNNQAIRCFTVEKAPSTKPLTNCTGAWEIANPQTTLKFTATGYFFAKLLNEVLNVPVGLIHASYGGTCIEAWMTRESLKDFPEKAKKIPASESVVSNWMATPTVMFNGMIYPIIGYGMRGVIWYQGEANVANGDAPTLYVKMFKQMVNEWRKWWNMGDFPFYYCQITPWNYSSLYDTYNSALLREAQSQCMQISNTGMAVLMDTRSPDELHAANKKDAGERLALWALAKTYGMKNIYYRSPEYKSMLVEGRLAIITFDMFGSTNGLTSFGKDIRNFVIAAKDKHFYPATATLAGDKVYLFSSQVLAPVAVRYCWDDTSATELFSQEGNLPVSSFRTDEW